MNPRDVDEADAEDVVKAVERAAAGENDEKFIEYINSKMVEEDEEE